MNLNQKINRTRRNKAKPGFIDAQISGHFRSQEGKQSTITGAWHIDRKCNRP